VHAAAVIGRYTLLAPSDRPLALARPARSPDELVVVELARASVQDDLPRAQRFVDELAALCRHEAPGLLRLRDAFLWRTGARVDAYLVHEYSPGFWLSSLLAQARRRAEPVPVDVAVAIARGALRAVHPLHTHERDDLRLAHGHLAPDRLLVGPDGGVRLGGLAARAPRPWPPARPLDDLGYLTPEQARRQPISPRTDLYQLAAILWETLTLRPRIQATDLLGVLEKILYAPPAPPSHLRPDTPPDLDRCVLRSLARSPQKRHAHALEFADDLGPGAPAPRVAAWALALGAEPHPGPEVYLLDHHAPLDPDPDPHEARPGKGPYR